MTDPAAPGRDLHRELALLAAKNERLSDALVAAREQIVELKRQVDDLGQAPGHVRDVPAARAPTARSTSSRRAARCTCGASPSLDVTRLRPARRSCSTRPSTVVEAGGYEEVGELVTVKELLGTDRALVVGRGDEERVVRFAGQVARRARARRRRADRSTRAAASCSSVIPRSEVEELVLEEVPDIDYERHRRARAADRGDPRRRRAAVPAPRAVPRARAQAAQGRAAVRPARVRQDAHRQGRRALARRDGGGGARRGRRRHASSYFLNVKGPELLNKYVGETERHIRLIFARAREKASQGHPVVVFFDEMESLFRTRGTGVSSDVETTIVPQLLSEIDGVERLENVIVIGASNREDMIDPAILRPGPARREDQDRAARRRGRAGDLRAST